MTDAAKNLKNTMGQSVTLSDDACTFSGGNEPCPTCPRKITAMYKCKLLQENLEYSTDKRKNADSTKRLALTL